MTGGRQSAEAPRRTPLEAWVAPVVGPAEERVALDELRAWQMARVRETVALAREHSPFYAQHLKAVDPDGLRAPTDLERVPLMTADELCAQGQRMVCARADEIERIVTLPTSGTTAAPKRVFFTEHDLGLTVDFFEVGMSTFTGSGDRVVVLMPGRRPGSIGELLQRALPRLGAEVLVHGPVGDVGGALRLLQDYRPTVLVGIPVQVLMLAEATTRRAAAAGEAIHSVLLSADGTVPALRRRIERLWDCRVYDHYGSTEMGFGGGVECDAHAGYHLRERDLLFEVADPRTGRRLGPGTAGEVVFTTLGRTGMPLVRYRTGDRAAFRPGSCSCGSSLPLLGHIQGRLDDRAVLVDGRVVTLRELDELLFAVDGVADYRVTLDRREGGERLSVVVRTTSDDRATREQAAAAARDQLARAFGHDGSAPGGPAIDITIGADDTWSCSTGMVKRTLVDERGKEVTHA